MFGFRKKKYVAEAEKNQDEKENAVIAATGHALDSSVQTTTEQAKIKYSKPAYNPKNRKAYYDNPQAHKDALDAAFSTGTVKDPYTGAELMKKQAEAKVRFGTDWQCHAAEADHIDPESQIVNRMAKNVLLTSNDVNEIANAADNFQVISRKLNQTSRDVGKGGSTQIEWANDPARMHGVAERIESGESIESVRRHIMEEGLAAEKRNNQRAIQKSLKNAVVTTHEAGLEGAKNAGITAVTMSGILNITAVIKGEKSAEEAIDDTIASGGEAAVAGYVINGGLTTTYQVLSGSSSKFVHALTESNIPGKVITALALTGDTLRRYGEGEISTQECLLELGEKGLNYATTGYSMAVGQALIPIPIVGAAVGALAGSMITSSYYNQLITTLQTKELEHQERLKIITECELATKQIQEYRAELESYLNSYFKDYQDCFDDALNTIKSSFSAGDANGVIAGANQITQKLGGQVQYNNMKEFKDYLFDDSGDIL